MISLAKAASRDLGHAGIFIEHATLTESDLDWLCDVERLTLWNVSIPKHFLRKLSALWWIDWRGGNANQGIDQIEEKDGLRYLSLNQIRGLSDLSFINKLMHLEMLNLYGLSKVTLLPSMIASETLRRVQLGQMKNLTSIGPVLEAPNLEEIQLHNWVKVSDDDVTTMLQHPSLASFEWFGENIPDRMWVPVCQAVGLPRTRPMHPEEWFGLPA